MSTQTIQILRRRGFSFLSRFGFKTIEQTYDFQKIPSKTLRKPAKIHIEDDIILDEIKSPFSFPLSSKALISEILKSKTFENLFEMLPKSEANLNLNPVLIVPFIQRISRLVFLLDSQSDRELLETNENMLNILEYVKKSFFSLNEYHFLEILVMIRRFRSMGLEFGGKIQDLLSEIVKTLDSTAASNVRLAVQRFHEYSLLQIPTKKLFFQLKTLIKSPNQQVYLTGYTISLAIKACAYNFAKSRRNPYGDFCYQLLDLLEGQLKLFDLGYLCRLFRNVCFLRLNQYTAQRKLHPCILAIRSRIIEEKAELQEKDVLCLLEALIHQPVSLDNSLLLYLKSTTLNTISLKAENLTLKFLIKFVDLMGQQFKEMRLNEYSLELIGCEILKRFEMSNSVKFSLIYDCFKAFGERNMYLHRELFAFLYRKLLETEEEQVNVNLLIFLLKIIIPIKLECLELALILKKKVTSKGLQALQIDKLLDLLYICSHPFFETEQVISELSGSIYQEIEKSLEKGHIEVNNSFLFYLAREYAHIKSFYFMKLQDLAVKTLKNDWEILKPARRFDLALSFVNSRFKREEWSLFLALKTTNLEIKELELLLNQYIYKESKEYPNFDLILNSLVSAKKETVKMLFRKVIEAFVQTPPFRAVSSKGNVNPKVKILMNLVDFGKDLKDFEADFTLVLKFARFFRVLELGTEFILPAFRKEIVMKEFSSGKELLLTEIGGFIAETLLLSEKMKEIKEKNKEKIVFVERNEKNVFFEKKEEKDVFGESLGTLTAIFEVLRAHFVDKTSKKSLSWLVNYGRIRICLLEYCKDFRGCPAMPVFKELKEKIEERKFDSKGIVVKALFLLIEMEAQEGFLDVFYKDFIRKELQKALDLASIPVLLPHLRFLEQRMKGKEERQRIKEFVEVVELFYLSNDFKKFPNVVARTLLFFARSGSRNELLYKKIIEEVNNNLNEFKTTHVLQLLRGLAIAKFRDQSILQRIAKKIEESLAFYEANVPEILCDLAKLMPEEKWVRIFSLKIWECYLQKHEKETEKYGNVDVLWALLTLEITEEKLIQGCFSAFKSYLTDSTEIHTRKHIVSEVFQLLKLVHSNKEHLKLSPNLFQKIETFNTNWLENERKNIEIPLFEDILTRFNEDFIKHFIVEGLFLADFYLPNRKCLIFVDFYEDNPQKSQNFSDMGRIFNKKRIIEALGTSYGYTCLQITENKLTSLGTLEKRLDFLKSKGLELTTTKI